jgi:hypothetical protein
MDTNGTLKQSVEYIKDGKKNEARNLLRGILKESPQDERAWFLYAQVAETEEQCIFCLRKVLILNPSNSNAQQQLSIQLAKQLDSDIQDNQMSIIRVERGEHNSTIQPGSQLSTRSTHLQKTGRVINVSPSKSATLNKFQVGVLGVLGLIIIAVISIGAIVIGGTYGDYFGLVPTALPSPTSLPKLVMPIPTPTKSDCDCEDAKNYLNNTIRRIEEVKREAGIASDIINTYPINQAAFAELSGTAKARYDYQHDEEPPRCLENFNMRVISMFYNWWQGLASTSNSDYLNANYSLNTALTRWGEINGEATELLNKMKQCDKPVEKNQQG